VVLYGNTINVDAAANRIPALVLAVPGDSARAGRWRALVEKNTNFLSEAIPKLNRNLPGTVRNVDLNGDFGIPVDTILRRLDEIANWPARFQTVGTEENR
jgi:hypothetical protein